MTKVQLHFDLPAELDDQKLMDSISRAHGIYGLHRVQLAADCRSVTVDYDASRLNPMEVEKALHRSGIPILARN